MENTKPTSSGVTSQSDQGNTPFSAFPSGSQPVAANPASSSASDVTPPASAAVPSPAPVQEPTPDADTALADLPLIPDVQDPATTSALPPEEVQAEETAAPAPVQEPTPVAPTTTPTSVVPPSVDIAAAQPGKDFTTTTEVSPAAIVGAKILIVEDEPDARTIFVDLLESENYEVSSAVDGNDALAKAAADKFDLILLDLVMPNKDGLETLQDLKSDPEKYGTPVIVVLTNISGDAAVEKAMALGAAGYRLKIDAEPEQLLKDVNDFLHGKKQDINVEKVGRSLI